MSRADSRGPQVGRSAQLYVHESGMAGSSVIVFLHGVGNSGGFVPRPRPGTPQWCIVFSTVDRRTKYRVSGFAASGQVSGPRNFDIDSPDRDGHTVLCGSVN